MSISPEQLAQHVAERLSVAFPTQSGGAKLFRVLLAELVRGEAVSNEHLAQRLAWPLPRVEASLSRIPSLERDPDDRIVGCGITLRPTVHQFQVGPRTLYTWCALDALMFPAVIGKPAKVRSVCPQSRQPIEVAVGPERLDGYTPADAMVSLLLPEVSADVRVSFCCHVHFLADPQAGDAWQVSHPGVVAVSLEEAFRVGQALVREMGWLG